MAKSVMNSRACWNIYELSVIYHDMTEHHAIAVIVELHDSAQFVRIQMLFSTLDIYYWTGQVFR